MKRANLPKGFREGAYGEITDPENRICDPRTLQPLRQHRPRDARNPLPRQPSGTSRQR